jgi:hypothetical protein
MLCQHLETIVDVAVNKWLQDDVTDDEKFHASLFPAVAPLYSKLGISFLCTTTCDELQWSILDTSCKSDMESIQEICECAFQNLKKARVIIAGIVLDGVPFMEEFGLNHLHHTHEQQNTMKQEHATIHQQLGLIQAVDGFLTPVLEDYYQALRISIEACVGEFHECVVQSHCCLACTYEYYAEHSMSSWEVMRDRRVARFSGVGV